MDNATIKKLYGAGYLTCYGAGQLVHFVKRSERGRGQRAICGQTASKWGFRRDGTDYLSAPLCTDCARQIVVQKDGAWFIVPA